jgi:hypothetical protein
MCFRVLELVVRKFSDLPLTDGKSRDPAYSRESTILEERILLREAKEEFKQTDFNPC